MIMRKTYFIIIAFLLITFCSREQKENTVARVGDIDITTDEFFHRYEFTPQIMQTKDKERNKRNFMTSLLGEKVFADIGYRDDYDDTEKYRAYSQQMEDEAIIEKLIETEITDKIDISTEELKRAFVKSKQNLELQVLNFPSEGDALEAKKMLDEGVSIHDVKRHFQTQTFISTDSVLTVSMTYGDAHPIIEDAAYGLNKGEVSDPVEVDGIYFVMKLVNRTQSVMLTEADFYSSAPSLKKTIRGRRSGEMLNEYMMNLMRDKRMKVSHEIFNIVAEELKRVYQITEDTAADDDMRVTNGENLEENARLADHMDDEFARFDDGRSWTVREFLTRLSVGPYPLNKDSEQKFMRSLRAIIRRMAEFEALKDRGRELNLDKSEFVKYQSQMWNDSFIAGMVKNEILDSVKISDEEVRHFYDRNKARYQRPEMLKLREIVVSSREEAIALMARINKGEDMAKLARAHTLKAGSGNRSGIEGFYTTQAWGEVGKIANKLAIGELGGPVALDSGKYSIFRLMDKLEAGPLPFADVYDDARSDALTKKKVSILDNYLANVYGDIDIEINHDVYDTLQIHDISMLVFKRHFPKRMAAPPVDPLLTSPQWQNKMDSVLR